MRASCAARRSPPTDSSGDAGPILFAARNLAIDGESIDDTGLVSSTAEGSTGRSGTLDVSIGGTLQVFDGGVIASGTGGSGNAGDLRISAAEVLLDGRSTEAFTGLFGRSEETATGTAGSIAMQVSGTLTMLGGSELTSTSYGPGDAGNINVHVGTLLMDGRATQDYFTTLDTTSGTGNSRSGNVTVIVDGMATLLGGAIIAADSYSDGPAGLVSVRARDLVIDGAGNGQFTGISSDALTGSGTAGGVEVRVGTAAIRNGGMISSDAYAEGNAGSVLVVATTLSIEGHDGGGHGSGITSHTLYGSGNAGSIRVEVDGLLSLANGGIIASSTFTPGNSGHVTVRAGSLVIVDSDAPFLTGISSQGNESTGDAGSVDVQVRGDATIRGSISSGALGLGNAGSVTVNVGGNLDISAPTRFLSGIYTNASDPNSGRAGDVEVTVGGRLGITAGGSIASDTYSAGNAGHVHVTAGSLVIQGAPEEAFTGISTNAYAGARGNAGDVLIEVTGVGELSQRGQIASSTFSAGNAGVVTVRAGTLVIDGAGTTSPTGVVSTASPIASGNSGRVNIEAGDLLVRNGGAVATTTFSPSGRAGTVDIHADRVLIDGAFNSNGSVVSARSALGASGQTGDVSITATESIAISDGGQVSIANDSTAINPAAVSPSRISLTAPSILVNTGGSVTAQSSGNVAASNIQVAARDLLWLNSGSITTSANLGNGGEIDITAGTARLTHAQVTTSVLGAVGNGGDINVHADVLRLETGFIQANTAARDAAGGNVAIETNILIATGSNVFVGGSTPINFAPGVFGLNVIQAAAPTGVSGTIELTSPVLDTAGALVGLGATPLDTSLLGRSPCRLGASSSLALAGRGGLAPSAREAFRLDPPAFAGQAFDPRRFATLGIPCARAHAAS